MNIVYIVLIGAALFFLVGTTFTGLLMDIGYLVMCAGCPEGRVAVSTGLAQLITAGQGNIKEGVNSLVDLRDNVNVTQAIESGLITERMVQSQIDTARWQIFGGIALTFALWFVIYIIVYKLGEWFVAFSPPFVMTLILTIVIAGLIQWAAIGFAFSIYPYIGPYDGFVTLSFNIDIWEYKLVESISPFPPEAHNLTPPGNYSL